MRKKFKDLLNLLKLKFRKSTYSGKVFCIGYNKTGTTSCGRAFELLGYKNVSFEGKNWRGLYKNKQYLQLLNYAAKFDSFDDLPWLKEDMIVLLDKVFPNSKFVYLERDLDSWRKSYYNWTYKITGQYPDMEKGVSNFLAHREFVMQYFKDRQNDLLIMKISEPGGFKKLAEFLGKKTDQTEMPHENKT
ncbi:MAG: hypothetical protein K0Q95_1375 [Bacteroidota bacterium]|jgi:hypothetical protein|nr:hypothetical protein [Bacteroidota bacterium]